MFIDAISMQGYQQGGDKFTFHIWLTNQRGFFQVNFLWEYRGWNWLKNRWISCLNFFWQANDLRCKTKECDILKECKKISLFHLHLKSFGCKKTKKQNKMQTLNSTKSKLANNILRLESSKAKQNYLFLILRKWEVWMIFLCMFCLLITWDAI